MIDYLEINEKKKPARSEDIAGNSWSAQSFFAGSDLPRYRKQLGRNRFAGNCRESHPTAWAISVSEADGSSRILDVLDTANHLIRVRLKSLHSLALLLRANCFRFLASSNEECESRNTSYCKNLLHGSSPSLWLGICDQVRMTRLLYDKCSIYGLACQAQQKITISGVPYLPIRMIKNFLFPKLKCSSSRYFYRFTISYFGPWGNRTPIFRMQTGCSATKLMALII